MSTPAPGLQLRDDGLIYIQFYNSYKEILDTGKIYPFTNEKLKNFALNFKIRATAAAAANIIRTPKKILEKSYIYNKIRVNTNINTARRRSFGVREKYRVS